MRPMKVPVFISFEWRSTYWAIGVFPTDADMRVVDGSISSEYATLLQIP